MAKIKSEQKLWLYVLATMAIIAALWAGVFYPRSLNQSGTAAGSGFSDFKNKFSRALAVFKKTPPPAAAAITNAEIDTLRERVFGDSTKRPQ